MHAVAATSIYIKQIHPLKKKNCTIQFRVMSVTINSLNKFSLFLFESSPGISNCSELGEFIILQGRMRRRLLIRLRLRHWRSSIGEKPSSIEERLKTVMKNAVDRAASRVSEMVSSHGHCNGSALKIFLSFLNPSAG